MRCTHWPGHQRHPSRQRRCRRNGTDVGLRHRADHKHARRAHRLGERDGLVPRQHPHRRCRRPDGADLGRRHRSHHQGPHRALRLGARGGLGTGSTRLAAGADDQTIRIWDPNISPTAAAYRASHVGVVRAVAGPRMELGWPALAMTEACGSGTGPPGRTPRPSRATPAECERWSGPPRELGWPAPAETGQCGSGIRPPVTHYPHRPHRPDTGAGLVPDGAHLASASTDQTVRIWDPTTGHTITRLTSHTGDVNAVAWSPDSACLATASSDRTVRIWDATMLQTTTTITHTSRVRAVAWSPDGRRLAPACDDGLIISGPGKEGRRPRSLCRPLSSWRGGMT